MAEKNYHIVALSADGKIHVLTHNSRFASHRIKGDSKEAIVCLNDPETDNECSRCVDLGAVETTSANLRTKSSSYDPVK